MSRNEKKWNARDLYLPEKIAKHRNTTPPMRVTVRTEMAVAIILPPMTASPVQQAWPRTPPTQIPTGFSREPRITVAICDRSPHSATSVRINALVCGICEDS